MARQPRPSPDRRPEPADQRQRDLLVEQHLDYANALAVKLRGELGAELATDELKGYAAQGLIEAAGRFDPARGVAFTTFAYYRIRGAMFDGLREIGWLDRASWSRQQGATNELLGNLADRTPAAEGAPIEGELGAVAQALDQVCTVFLAAEAGNDVAADGPEPEDALATAEASRALRAAVRALPDRERKLVELFYFKDKSLKEAGAKLGLSKSWASRLHARAIGLLTESLQL